MAAEAPSPFYGIDSTAVINEEEQDNFISTQDLKNWEDGTVPANELLTAQGELRNEAIELRRLSYSKPPYHEFFVSFTVL